MDSAIRALRAAAVEDTSSKLTTKELLLRAAKMAEEMPFIESSSSVCVVSIIRNNSYHGDYPVAELQENKEAYCRRCGYRCLIFHNQYATDRSAGWDKLLALQDALSSQCSLALWLDADVVVLRPVRLAPLARTPISATKDFHGFNTGVMLLSRAKPTDVLLRTAWNQTAFVPNRLGAEQSAVRYTFHTHKGLREATTIYGNLVRYPIQLAVSAAVKWNITKRLAAPLFHTAGCSMAQRSRTCAGWLRHQLKMARLNWQQESSGEEQKCLAFGDDVSLPRKMKKSDLFIPFGQGRDVVMATDPDALTQERAAVDAIERRACEFSRRADFCTSLASTHSSSQPTRNTST